MSLLVRCSAVVWFLLVANLLAPSTSHAQSVAAGSYQVILANSPTACLDVAGPSQTPGAALQLYTCGDPVYSKNQVFKLTPLVSSTGVAAFQMVSSYSSQCLDVAGVSKADGASLQQYTCGNGYSLNQLWTFRSYTGGYEITSVNAPECIDVPGGNSKPGTQMQQWSCGGGYNPNQLWRLVPVGVPTPPVQPAAATIPASFFGLTILNALNKTMPLTISGTRSLDSYPGVNWRDLEPMRGVYNMGNLDLYLAANAARGTDMIYTFNAIPDWASSYPAGRTANGDGNCGAPANMADWDDFVRAVVTRSAGRIKYWEIWNEPQYFFCGDPAALVTMAQHAYTIVKSIDPSALILSPAGTTEGGPAMLDAFLAGGGGAYVDVINCHGYHYYADEDLMPTLAAYRTLMTRYNIANKPLWDTESDWHSLGTSYTAAGRAAYVGKSYLLHASAGVARFYWYAYDSTRTWGGLAVDGPNAPEVVAYRQIRRWMLGATLSQACAANSMGTWACILTRSNGYIGGVVWNPTQSTTFTVPSGFTQYRKLDGTTVSVTAGTVLTIGNSPILVETGSAF